MVEKIFGTDGIRGIVNQFPLTKDIIAKLAMSLPECIPYKEPLKVLIGKDTRDSGNQIEQILTGFLPESALVHSMGTAPTPAVSTILQKSQYNVGIMITASHNPAKYNGIKLFLKNGEKLPAHLELQLEKSILNQANPDNFVPAKPKHVDAMNIYKKHVCQELPVFKGDNRKIAIDCANGSASIFAPQIFTRLGLNVIAIGQNPDGRNINAGCGCTNPVNIIQATYDQDAELGISYDGDADRAIFCDSCKNLYDGDDVLYILANYMKSIGKLRQNTVVVTEQSNSGLEKSLKERNIKVKRVKTGDKNVALEMKISGVTLGGEPCGHIIFGNQNHCGDGIATSLYLISVMQQTGKTMQELTKGLQKYPYSTENIKVKQKIPLEQLTNFQHKLAKAQNSLGHEGRILPRYSGTENCLRLLIESPNEKFNEYVKKELKKSYLKEVEEKCAA